MSAAGITQLVEDHGVERVEIALELMSLYRCLRLMMLMDESGHRDWNGIAYDELQTMLCEISESLGLKPDESESQEAMQRFITFRMSRLNSMSYNDYLRTPEWQDVRYFALQKAGGRCQACNAESRLHVHHRTYARRGHEDVADVTVLCAGCHKAFHQNRTLSR